MARWLGFLLLAGRVLDVALLVLGEFSLLKWMDPTSSSVHLLYLEATEESCMSFWFTETWVLQMFLFVNCCVALEDVCLSHCVSTESSTI